jgi:antitoxin component of MazEF toxin-antitoxin module
MALETKVFQVGGSLAVVIPKDLCNLLGIKEDDELEVDMIKTNSEQAIILKK